MSSSALKKSPVFLALFLLFGLCAFAPAVSGAGVEALDECSGASSAYPAPDGSVYVAGSTRSCEAGAASKPLVIKLGPDGELDPGFAGGGILELEGGAAAGIVEIFPASDGLVVVTRNGVYRFKLDGTADGDFGSGGQVTVDFGSAAPLDQHRVVAATVDDDGSVLLLGLLTGSSGSFVPAAGALAKLDSAGVPVASFGEGGVAEAAATYSSALALDEMGRVYVSSFNWLNEGFTPQLARFTAEGKVDSAYGPLGNGIAYVPAMEADPNVVNGGSSYLRLLADGSAKVGGGYCRMFTGHCEPTGYMVVFDPQGGVSSLRDGLETEPTTGTPNGNWIGKSFVSVYSEMPTGYSWTVHNDAGSALGQGSLEVGPVGSTLGGVGLGATDSFGAGTSRREGFCVAKPSSDSCETSIVVAKAVFGGGLDESWGTDRGVTILPAIECRHGEITGGSEFQRKKCRSMIPATPFKPTIQYGRTRRPAVSIELKSPDWRGNNKPETAVAGNCSSAQISLRFPTALKVRGKAMRRKIRVGWNDRPLKRDSFSVEGHSIRVSIGCQFFAHEGAPLEVRMPRGSFRPLAKKARTRPLNFNSFVSYRFYSGEQGYRGQTKRVRATRG